jgi:hypothetical protein
LYSCFFRSWASRYRFAYPDKHLALAILQMAALKKEQESFSYSFTCWVVPAGGVSNFLPEDFDAVLKFMNAEVQKKKRKL